MKKILLFLSLFTFSSCSYISEFSKNDIKQTINITNTENNIFKIMSYKHNSKFNTYEQYSFWSSVLLADNELITNAHVLVDENQKMLDSFVACYNENSTSLPDCRFIANVKYIDKDNDLAILSINKKDINEKNVKINWWVNLYNWKLSIQDDIYTYWYPYIWWNTITSTKWKISGFSDNWDVKTDAKIDSWSSWWWAFIWKELVWISTYIVSDNDTIWYVKPINKVKDFLKNKDTFSINTKEDSNFLTYYKKIYEYNNWKWVYSNNWVTFTWFLNDFSLNYISYDNLTDYLIFSWINSNKDIDVLFYTSHVYNWEDLTNRELFDLINNYYYKDITKVCDNVNSIQDNKNYKCMIHDKSKNWDYIKYIWYVRNQDKLYTTLVLSDESNWKDEEYIKQLFSQIESKISYSPVTKVSNNFIWDIDISGVSNFIQIVSPSSSSVYLYDVALLSKNNNNIQGSIKIINNQYIKKIVNNWTFNYETYTYLLNSTISKKTWKDIYEIKKDKKWNQYLSWEIPWMDDSLYVSYDWYVYETIFLFDEKKFPRAKFMINRALDEIKMTDILKANKDNDFFVFNTNTKRDLDGDWYVYENSLVDWAYDDSWIWYYIASRNENVDVSNWTIILKNTKKDWHINLAQTIKYSDDLLNKSFTIVSNSTTPDDTSYTIKLIIWKYMDDWETQYRNREYNLIFLNNWITSTDKVSDLVDEWRKKYNYDDSVKPDIVRVSIWINNLDWLQKFLNIKEISFN